MIDNATFAIDPNWYNGFKGFVNLTEERKAPIFLSSPHFFGGKNKKKQT